MAWSEERDFGHTKTRLYTGYSSTSIPMSSPSLSPPSSHLIRQSAMPKARDRSLAWADLGAGAR